MHVHHENTVCVRGIVGDTQQHQCGFCVPGAYPLFMGMLIHTCKIINIKWHVKNGQGVYGLGSVHTMDSMNRDGKWWFLKWARKNEKTFGKVEGGHRGGWVPDGQPRWIQLSCLVVGQSEPFLPACPMFICLCWSPLPNQKDSGCEEWDNTRRRDGTVFGASFLGSREIHLEKEAELTGV